MNRTQIKNHLKQQGIKVTDYQVKKVIREEMLPELDDYSPEDSACIIGRLGGSVVAAQSEALPHSTPDQAESGALVAIARAAEPFAMVHAAIDAAEDAQAEQLAQRVEQFVPNVLTRTALKLKDRQPAKVSVLDVILTGLMPSDVRPALNPMSATHLMAPH